MKNKRIIFTIFILTALFLIPITSASWNESGNIVCIADDNQIYIDMTYDTAGNAILVWQDYRNSHWDIFAQKIDTNGIPKWNYNGNGIIVGNHQVHPKIICDDLDCIIVWGDSRGGSYYDIYVQKLDTAGMEQWGTSDVLVCNLNEFSVVYTGSYDICSDGNEGAIIVWEDFRGGGTADLYIQKINAYGIPQWGDNGTALCTEIDDQYHPEIISDGNGGAFITWIDARGLDTDIYIQKVLANGSFVLGNNGIAICTADESQWYPKLTSDGDAGAIIAWQDARSGGYDHWDIYSQRIDKIGNLHWDANGTVVCNSNYKQEEPELCSDGSGGAYIVWKDIRDGNYDIYIQHLNSLGNRLFENNGKAICVEAYSQNYPDLCSDGNGNVIIAWMDRRNGTYYHIYAQQLDSSGNLKWDINGKSICLEDEDQKFPVVCYNGDKVIIAWEDYRVDGSTSDIYAYYAEFASETENIPGFLIGFLLIGILSLIIFPQLKTNKKK